MKKRFSVGWRSKPLSAAVPFVTLVVAVTAALTGPTGTAAAAARPGAAAEQGAAAAAQRAPGPRAGVRGAADKTVRTDGLRARRAAAAREIASAGPPEPCPASIALGTVYSCTPQPGGNRYAFHLAKATDLVFVLLVGADDGDPAQRITAPDGSTVACTRPPGNGFGAWRCPTHAAGTYTLSAGASGAFSMEVSALLSDPSCTQVTEADTSLGAPKSFATALPAGSTGHCYALPTARGEVLRTHVSNWHVRQSVNDAAGKEVCATSPNDGGPDVSCRLTGKAPYRLLAYDPVGASVDGYDFTADRLSRPAGCPVVEPSPYGTAPGGTAAARCRIMRVPTDGPYFYGSVGNSGSESTDPLYRADGTPVCTATTGEPCTLSAGDYTYTGALGNGPSEAYSSWLHAADGTQGCTAARDDAFASGPATGTFTAPGQRLCRTLPTGSGRALYLFNQPPAQGSRPVVRVLDAAGVQQCLAEYVYEVCKLTGKAPFRAVLSGAKSGEDYRIFVQRTGETAGCAPWKRTGFGRAPGTKVQLTAERPFTCLSIPARDHSAAEIFDYTSTTNRRSAYIEVYDGAGELVCRTSYYISATACSFTPGTDYAAVLYGNPDTYRPVRRDVSATAKCATPKSLAVGGASTGYTFTSATDSTCLRVTGAASDRFWFSARSSTKDESGALLGVVDASGHLVCWQWGVSCHPTGSPSYVVFALANGYTGKAIPTRLDTWRVGSAAGWDPKCTAHRVSAEGFAPRSGVFTESATAYCAVVAMKPRREFTVVGTYSAGYPNEPWVSMLNPVDFASDNVAGPYQCNMENMGELRARCGIRDSAPTGDYLLVLSPHRTPTPVEYTIQGVCSSGCAGPHGGADASSLSPATGAAGTGHLVVLHGRHLNLGTRLELEPSHGSGRTASAVAVSASADGTSLTVRLYTTPLKTGRYDLVVDSPGYAKGTRSYGYLPKAFTVTAAPKAAHGRFIAVTPQRILDTSAGTGAPKARIGAGRTVKLKVTGLAGVPVSGTTAVVMNLTAARPAANGRITAWPAGAARPDTTALSTVSGRNTTAAVVVPVRNGAVELRNSGGSTDLSAEVTGYFTTATSASGGKLTTLTPKRVLDTREGTGAPKAPVGAGGTVKLRVAGLAGVPATGATSVVVNLTAVRPTADGHVTAWADGTRRPNATNLSFTAGRTSSSTVIVPVRDGVIDLRNSAGSVDLVADVTGYFSSTGAQFTPTGPVRLLDTATGFGARSGAVGPGGFVSFPVLGLAGVPAEATAVTLAVTAGSATATSYLTVSPRGRAWPGLAALEYGPGRAATNLVTVPVVDGRVVLTNHAGSVQLSADLAGYFTD